MPVDLSAVFSSPIGKWDGWDSNTPNAGAEGFLTSVDQRHVDLRTFQQTDLRVPQTQEQIDTLAQADVVADAFVNTLDDMSQTEVESIIATPGEKWGMQGTGFVALVVGKDSLRNNWKSLRAQTDGSAVNTDFISAIAVESEVTASIDISMMDKLSIIFPDFTAFDNTSYVQLTSHPNGTFGDTTYNSTGVTLTGSLVEERHLLSALASGAGASFTLAGITGVRVHIDVATPPAAGLNFTMMAIRAIDTSWTNTVIDFDTREHKLVTAVTLDGSAPIGSFPPIFRGTGSADDPAPSDATVQINFLVGTPGVVHGDTGNYNVLSAYLREKDDGITDSWIRVTLRWNDVETWIDVFTEVYTISGGGFASTLLVSQMLFTDVSAAAFGSQTGATAFAFDPVDNNTDPILRDFNRGQYEFEVALAGDAITVRLWQMTALGETISQAWPNAGQQNTYTSTMIPFLQGRVGFLPILLDLDTEINAFIVSETGFAALTTQVFASNTPVDGAQLQAAYADDMNLFDVFYGPDLFRDPTKTQSGQSSFRSAAQLLTNQFVIEDWENSYIAFDINVVAADSGDGFLTLLGANDYAIDVGALAPNLWNHVEIDLDLFSFEATGRVWQLGVGWPGASNGFYWIDNMAIGRRRVAWQVRALTSGVYRPFRGLVNDPDGAVHLPRGERGTALQLQAKALTQDAWIAGFVLIPHYAQLGAPLYMSN